MNQDNVIVIPSGLVCTKCKQAVALQMPLPLGVGLTLIKAFGELHQFCGERTVFTGEVFIGVEVSEERCEVQHG